LAFEKKNNLKNVFSHQTKKWEKYVFAWLGSDPAENHVEGVLPRWSVVAEWLGCRTLNQRVVGSNPGEGTVWYL
jgi:hypothetical protein